MAALQRSAMSYRREGSSGAVWSQKLLPELILDKERIDPNELRHSYSVGGPSMLKNETKSSASSAAAVAAEGMSSPVTISRSSSLSVSALKLLNPKSVGQKFKGFVGSKPPKYGKQFQLGRV